VSTRAAAKQTIRVRALAAREQAQLNMRDSKARIRLVQG
jgi:hypothetical protein